MTKYIKAPFNFVPLNSKVVECKNPENISHVVPFTDGENGFIELTLTAKSPVFIKNGTTQQEKRETMVFSHIIDQNGKRRFFIPGTSLKGMFKSVLEILSEGYLRVQKEMRFAVRDWNDQKVYPIKNPNIQLNLRCGWLQLNEFNDSIISDHGLPYRINHLALDQFFETSGINVSLSNEFSRPPNDLPDDKKDASYKYELLGTSVEKLDKLSFSEHIGFHGLINGKTQNPPAFTERRVSVDPNGSIKGTIVFTGQPDRWKNPETDGTRGKGDGKFYEFVFPSKEVGKFIIKKDVVDQIKFIYQDSPSSEYFKGKGKIPVFFRTEKINGEWRVKDFGLALLYRLPYEYTALDLVKKGQDIEHRDNLIDIADSIFGSIKQDKKSTLLPFKGRVQVGHAFASENSQEHDEVIKRLGSPKASYLPIYIDQSALGRNGTTSEYKSYHDKDALLSGWKRYPVHYGANISGPDDGYNKTLDVKFLPLKQGSQFKCKIRFHNLKPYEVGALLSTITFHGNEKQLCHSLGMAKSHGFGKVSVEIETKGLQSKVADYLAQFELFISEQNKNANWIQQSRIIELMTMAWDKKTAHDDMLLKYMKMDNNPQINEFLLAKGGLRGNLTREYLERYTALSKQKFLPVSFMKDYMDKLSEERQKADEDRHQKEIDAIEQDRIDRENAKLEEIKNSQKRKLNEGLSILSKHTDWNRAQKEIEKYLKLSGNARISDDQSSFLYDFLKRFLAGLNVKDKKEWQKDFKENIKWKKISNWIGDDIALKWFKEFNK